jgi:hypothetical protein
MTAIVIYSLDIFIRQVNIQKDGTNLSFTYRKKLSPDQSANRSYFSNVNRFLALYCIMLRGKFISNCGYMCDSTSTCYLPVHDADRSCSDSGQCIADCIADTATVKRMTPILPQKDTIFEHYYDCNGICSGSCSQFVGYSTNQFRMGRGAPIIKDGIIVEYAKFTD